MVDQVAEAADDLEVAGGVEQGAADLRPVAHDQGVGPGGGKSKAAAQADADEAAAALLVTIRLVGQTVDIQALTRFVRQLEDSPWLENVTLSRSEDVIVQPANKEVKEFTLDMRIHRPDSTFLRRVPLTVGVR